jgi:pimeloyl-ACP methyl ester carboxylesterase
MSPTKPTIVIIPGSFSAYGAYDPFLALLRAEGFTAVAVNLPSTQKRMPLPPATLKDDAALVRGVVGALVAENEGTEVVVLAHSYGGSVATEALTGLGVKEGKKGGVRRLVFLSAVVPKVGETQVQAMKLDEAFLPAAVVSFTFLLSVELSMIFGPVCGRLKGRG